MADAARTLAELAPAYERDFAAWAHAQAEALRTARPAGIDWQHVAEELTDLGNSEFKAFVSALEKLIEHQLKWDLQPERRGNSWANTIAVQRDHAASELAANPSFAARRDEALAIAWRRGVRAASSAMDKPMRDMPSACPYDWDAIMARPIEWEPGA